MSVYVTREIWKYSRSEHGARLTLLAIGDSAHKDYGTCRLKQASIAQMTRLGETAVRDAIRWLEDADEIETRQAVKGRARINVYRVILGEYAQAIVDEDDLGVRLLERFSTVDEIAARRTTDTASRPAESAGRGRADDQRKAGRRPSDSAAHKEEPDLNRFTREANASLVPPAGGEREEQKLEISLALSAALGVQLQGMTRGERGAWEAAVAQLADVGATRDEVTGRATAYRTIWPTARLTPMALVRHWSRLGLEVEIGTTADPVAAWVEKAPDLFDRQTAHELLDDRRGLSEAARSDYRARLDARYDEQARHAA